MKPHECADHTCKYNVKYHCHYSRLWNKALEGRHCCSGYLLGRDELAKALREKRGQVLRAKNCTAFDYVGSKGLLFECLQRGKT